MKAFEMKLRDRRYLSIRKKNGKVIITFNEDNWDDSIGVLLDQFCYDLRNQFTVADILKQAIHMRAEAFWGHTFPEALEFYMGWLESNQIDDEPSERSSPDGPEPL